MKSTILKTLATPKGYTISNSGVYFGLKQLSNTPIWVSAKSKTKAQCWGVKINWLIQHDIHCSVIDIKILHASNKIFMDVLQHLGIDIITNPMKLKQYLALQSFSEPSIEAMQDIQLLHSGKINSVHYATST